MMTNGQAGIMRAVNMSLSDDLHVELIDIGCFFPYTQFTIKKLLGWSKDPGPHVGG